MRKIHIYYLVKDPIEASEVEKIAQNLKSNLHEVKVSFYDFGAAIDPPEGCELITKDADEIGNFNMEITKSLISNISTDALCVLQQGCVPREGCLDRIDWGVFDNPDFSSIYCDYNVRHEGTTVRTYMKSPPVDEGAPLPMVFFSTRRLAEVSSGKDLFQQAFNKYAGYHIPHSLCEVSQ